MEYFLVGRIVGTHGINGELKVINESDFDRFFVGNTLYINKDNKYKKITISSVRYHKNFVLITINNLTNINDVLDYVNSNIYIKDREILEDGRYYIDQIIGLNVVNQDGENKGVVSDMIELPNQKLLEIKQSNGKVSLVPYVDAFVKKVDIENKTITIQEIEGLL